MFSTGPVAWLGGWVYLTYLALITSLLGSVFLPVEGLLDPQARWTLLVSWLTMAPAKSVTGWTREKERKRVETGARREAK